MNILYIIIYIYIYILIIGFKSNKDQTRFIFNLKIIFRPKLIGLSSFFSYRAGQVRADLAASIVVIGATPRIKAPSFPFRSTPLPMFSHYYEFKYL